MKRQTNTPPLGLMFCDDDCPGYRQDSMPGCLWDGETDADFGFQCCDHATKPLPTVAEMTGIDPDLTGNLSTEEFIRSIRRE